MHLREARLCLDSEELHVADRCPRCASDAFAFVTRWIPVAERRAARRPPPRPAPPSRLASLARGGVTGMVLVAAARWLWRFTGPDEKEAPARDPSRAPRRE
jgi:hypothetical protein